MAETQGLDRALTVREIAEELAITKGTVYELIKKSGLPVFRVGTDFRIRRSRLREWEAAQEVRA